MAYVVTDRAFGDFPTATMMVDPTIPPRGAHILKCRICGGIEKIGHSKSIHLPPAQIAKKFMARGWQVGDRRTRDMCPQCNPMNIRKEVEVLAVEQEPKVVSIVPKAAEPPPQMTRDDGRVIFAKVNDVYVDERVGYGNGWTDARVAEDLGVPRAWVVKVREEHFGPEASNEEIRVLIAEARALYEAARVKAQEVRSWLETAARIEKSIQRLSKQVGLT